MTSMETLCIVGGILIGWVLKTWYGQSRNGGK